MIYVYTLLVWFLVYVLIYSFAFYKMLTVKIQNQKSTYELDDYIVFISNDWSSLYS